MPSAWVPIFVKDRLILDAKAMDARAREWVLVEERGPLLDGPTTERVALLDFDPDTGALRPGLGYKPPARGVGHGRYLDLGAMRYNDPDSLRCSVFGTVYKVIAMYEAEDCLGRPVRWGFEGPQLLVVPRAGEWANAFYERASRSLQFFYFADDANQRVYTAQSQDIVAHETAHAILDGIAPELYNAQTPQSLAIHEAVADLTAVMAAIASKPLRRAIAQNPPDLRGWNGFSALAGEFGHARDPHQDALRELHEKKTLATVPDNEPHALSVVLSGALYSVFVEMYEQIRAERLEAQSATPEDAQPDGPQVSEETPAEQAIKKAGRRFRRTILRALDYLPPGEASFADFGRAILAADQASHPDSEAQRRWLAGELRRRGIVRTLAELQVRTLFEHRALRALDLDELLDSDYCAYQFAERNRRLLSLPPGVPFRVQPRLDARKATWHAEGRSEIREVIVKVSWTTSEPVAGRGRAHWPRRHLVRGTTLVIDRPTRRVRAVLTNVTDARLRRSRDSLLARLLSTGLLMEADEARGVDGSLPRGVVLARTLDGALRLRNSAHMLHIAPAPERGGRP